jgi:hypothetical protein
MEFNIYFNHEKCIIILYLIVVNIFAEIVRLVVVIKKVLVRKRASS